MIQSAYCAVDSNSTNGAQTVRNESNVAQVNRTAAGTFAVHFTDDLCNTQYAVIAGTNGGAATEWYIGYNRVSARQCNIIIIDSAGAGADIDFTMYVLADADASIGA